MRMKKKVRKKERKKGRKEKRGRKKKKRFLSTYNERKEYLLIYPLVNLFLKISRVNKITRLKLTNIK